MQQPTWLEHAWKEFGEREVPGPANNGRILQFFKEVGHPDVGRDDVAWCAAFLGATLERAGVPSTRSLLARSYLKWGTGLDAARIGAIAVLSRGADPGQGHVGFLLGTGGETLYLLGGNQRDAVTVQGFPRSRLLALRWPDGVENSEAAVLAGEGLFDTALAHVLEMEGGWSDDPYDPGGPTNRGITLAVYAAWKGVALDASNSAALVQDLKKIDPAEVRRIYQDRYWAPSRSARLPAPVALIHFDAAVNHGVANAARMLQEALGVTIDGEIGPQTLAAARTRPTAEIVARYADIRRARYRSLGHFWRFGRGWLRRVNRTVALTRGITPPPPSLPHQSRTGDSTMTTQPTASGKWWGHSLTIWGAIITAASTVLPALGPLLGIDITPELVRQLGDHVVDVAQAVGGLVGIIMTIYGRTRATTPIERRRLTIQL